MSDIASDTTRLPVGSVRLHGSGWLGVWCLVAAEGALFAYLLFSYFYCALQTSEAWPPGGKPHLILPAINTAVLLASSVAVWFGEQGVRNGSRSQLLTGLVLGTALGMVFVGIQLVEWSHKSFSLSSSLYGSLFFTITGFHMAHVVIGILMLLVLLVWSSLGLFSEERHGAISVGAVYWHFVDAVWIAVFTSLYLSPYLG